MTLQDEIKTIQDQIKEHEAAIRRLQGQQAHCSHEWGEIKYTPRVEAGYNAKGFVRMGHSNSPRHDIWVPRVEHPCWTRHCKTCGLPQSTEQTHEVTKGGSMPGVKAKEQVPVFPGNRR